LISCLILLLLNSISYQKPKFTKNFSCYPRLHLYFSNYLVTGAHLFKINKQSINEKYLATFICSFSFSKQIIFSMFHYFLKINFYLTTHAGNDWMTSYALYFRCEWLNSWNGYFIQVTLYGSSNWAKVNSVMVNFYSYFKTC